MNKRSSIKFRRMRNSTKDIWQLRREWVNEIKEKERKEKALKLDKTNEPLLLKYF
mgnify:CR=1 FL=1